MSFGASLCDTDTKCGIPFFRVFFIVLFYIFDDCAHFHCYEVQACTNTRVVRVKCICNHCPTRQHQSTRDAVADSGVMVDV